MSKTEILKEFTKLAPEDRREVFEGICEIEEHHLLNNPSPEEKALLDQEREEFRANPDAGSTWNEVESRLRKTGQP